MSNDVLPSRAETCVVNMRTSAYDVAIDRSGPFGNPYAGRDRQESIERYRKYFLARVKRDPIFRDNARALRGKRLGCHCAPKPCHGMVIVEWLKEQEA